MKKNKKNSEERSAKIENYFAFGLGVSELMTLLIAIPIIVLGLFMAMSMTNQVTPYGITGVVITILGGGVYVALNLIKLVDWALDIEHFMSKRLSPVKNG